MRGFIETVAEHEITGWAFDEATPDAHVAVAAFLRGHQIAVGAANLFRSDLQDAGLGIGDHAFRLTFWPRLLPGEVEQVEIRAGATDTAICLDALPNSNHSFADAASTASFPITDPDARPVFILGPARSGTSALALALTSVGLHGHGEGHLLPLAHRLLEAVGSFYDGLQVSPDEDTLVGAVTQATFQRMVRRGFVQLTRTAFPSGRWVDKTPTAEMIRSTPHLKEIWPNAVFILLRRRVIENVLSRCRKFPEVPVAQHYFDWADVLSAWLAVRSLLGSAVLEIDQHDLATQPFSTADQIGAAIGLDAAQRHRLGAELAFNTPERTSSRIDGIAAVAELGLDQWQVAEMHEVCDTIMTAYHYSWTSDYYLSGKGV